MSILYRGTRDPASGRCRVVAVDAETGAERELKAIRRRDVRFHSPDGYEWGYGGSGPAQLAQDLVREVLTREPPAWLYQAFKWEFIAGLPHEAWELSAATITQWLNEQSRAAR